MKIGIRDIVNIKEVLQPENESNLFWKGEVTRIHNREWITVEGDKTENYAEIKIDILIFKDNEWWEK